MGPAGSGPGMSPTWKTETCAWSVRNPLAPGKMSIVSRRDALQGQKLKIPQDQPPSFVPLNTSEA